MVLPTLTLRRSLLLSALILTLGLLAAGQPPTSDALLPCQDLPANNGGGAWRICYAFNEARDRLRVLVSAEPIAAGGWLGFGFNSNRASMNGANVVIGRAGADSFVGEYRTASYDVQQSTQLGFTDMSVSEVDGGSRVQLAFTAPVQSQLFDASSNANIIFARGPPPSSPTAIPPHQGGSRGNFLQFNFLDGSSSASDPLDKYRRAHGLMMAFAWGLVMPLGIIAARHFRPYYAPAWFNAHRLLMVLGLALALAAWIIGLAKIADGRHPTHRALGFAAMILALANPVIALVRPHPPKEGERPTMARRVWAFIHHNVGRAAYVLAIVNVFIGLSYFNRTPGEINRNTIIFLVCWLAVMAIGIALEIRAWIHPHTPPFGSMPKAQPQMTGMVPSKV